MSRRAFAAKAFVFGFLGLFLAFRVFAGGGGSRSAAPPVPVILDTDIGDDIDDTWALILLLKSPELDLKLVTTTHGKALYRAALAAGILETSGRTDVPVGLGAGGRDGSGPQQGWADRFDGGKSRVKIVEDGVGAMIRIIRQSPEPVTIISIGPSTTVAAAMERDPGIASKAVFVGMQGSVRKGYDGGPVGPEYNVKENVSAAKRALLAPWRRTVITPLDTCGQVRLAGERFQALGRSRDPRIGALLENYRIWAGKKSIEELLESSVLFDTVAVYLALPGAKPYLQLEDLRIGITPEGLTVIDPSGAGMSVATSWSDLEGYEDFLVKRLAK